MLNTRVNQGRKSLRLNPIGGGGGNNLNPLGGNGGFKGNSSTMLEGPIGGGSSGGSFNPGTQGGGGLG